MKRNGLPAPQRGRSSNPCTERRQPGSAGCTLQAAIYTAFCKRHHYRDRKQASGCRQRLGEAGGTDYKGARGIPGATEAMLVVLTDLCAVVQLILLHVTYLA